MGFRALSLGPVAAGILMNLLEVLCGGSLGNGCIGRMDGFTLEGFAPTREAPPMTHLPFPKSATYCAP